MAIEKVTIARPYAKAAFSVALAQNAVDSWQQALALLKEVSQDERVISLLTDPRLSLKQKAEFFVGMLPNTTAEQTNFVNTLAENRRLNILPEIAEQFNLLRAEHEQTMTVHVNSFNELTEHQQQAMRQALEKRLQRKVKLDCTQDKSLLGGAVVRAGDLVIDGSARGALHNLAIELVD
ncbi:MAG: F0F1 ATP synthase subunit delta [Gammaproteobacteria bacterium]